MPQNFILHIPRPEQFWKQNNISAKKIRLGNTIVVEYPVVGSEMFLVHIDYRICWFVMLLVTLRYLCMTAPFLLQQKAKKGSREAFILFTFLPGTVSYLFDPGGEIQMVHILLIYMYQKQLASYHRICNNNCITQPDFFG